MVRSIFCNLSQAFDGVCHYILIENVSFHDSPENSVKLIKGYVIVIMEINKGL